jgi:hypothetical protein
MEAMGIPSGPQVNVRAIEFAGRSNAETYSVIERKRADLVDAILIGLITLRRTLA